MSRGQSFVELAVCAPVVVLLAIGTVTLVELDEAKQALDSATGAAVAAAVRAPDGTIAASAAQARFEAIATGSGLDGAVLRLQVAGFERGSTLRGDSSTQVEPAWGRLLGLPSAVVLRSSAEAVVDQWRSRAPA